MAKKRPVKAKPAKTKTKSKFGEALKKQAKVAKKLQTIPFRSLDKDGVTYSFLSEFLTCRESARLSYVEGYTQKGLIEAFAFGTAIHNCLEAQGKAKGKTFNHNKILLDFKVHESKYLMASEKHELNRIVEMARIVWPEYMKYWQAKRGMEVLPDCEFVSNEEDFKLSHELPNGREIYLRGRLDGVLRYQGELWLMENKTKSVIDGRLTDYLPHDMQTQMYCHAVAMKYKEPVRGILYNVIRRPGLRLGKQESVNGLLQRIAKDVSSRPEHYFLRWNVYLDPQDTAKWVAKVLNPLLMQVQMWWDEIIQNPFDPFSIPNRVHHFASPEGLFTRYGRSNYFDMLTTGSDFGLMRRTK